MIPLFDVPKVNNSLQNDGYAQLKGDNSVNIDARGIKLTFFERKLNFAQNAFVFGGMVLFAKQCDNSKANAFSLSQIEKMLTQQFLSDSL